MATGKTTTTDANGNYKFDGLLPSTYRVVETQPDGYLSVGDTPGTVNGETRGVVTTVDILSSINLDGGDDSIHNDFAETRPASCQRLRLLRRQQQRRVRPRRDAIGGVQADPAGRQGQPHRLHGHDRRLGLLSLRRPDARHVRREPRRSRPDTWTGSMRPARPAARPITRAT